MCLYYFYTLLVYAIYGGLGEFESHELSNINPRYSSNAVVPVLRIAVEKLRRMNARVGDSP